MKTKWDAEAVVETKHHRADGALLYTAEGEVTVHAARYSATARGQSARDATRAVLLALAEQLR